MGKGISMRIVVIVVILASLWVAATAQQSQNPSQTTQNQSQTQNQQQNQNQQSQPTQAQPTQTQKKSFWQKVKDAQTALQQSTQQGQNTAQQGQSTVQQGAGAVQQTMQNGAQGVQNGAQQGMQSVQQGVQGGSSQASGAFSGGGGGAGACGQSCFDAGPFQANVAQMTMSQEGAWHVIRMNIQFHNSTNQPLTIAYHDGSMVMVDNNGASYIPAGGNPGELQGMGIDRGAQTDSQFVLAPGQTGSALFSVARGRGPTSPVGTSYSYNLTIDELQAQNGAMAIPVRTYNLNFPSLAAGTSNASFSKPSATQPSVATTKPSATPASVVNNAAMKTPVTNNATQRPTVVVVKPIPATAPANAAKKTTTTTTSTPATTTTK